MESLTWRSGLFGPAGEFASEVERLQQSIRCEMSMSIDDGSRNDHVPEISTPNGEEREPTLAEIVRAMNGQQEVLLNLCRNVSESRTPMPRHSSPIPLRSSEAGISSRKSRKMVTPVLEDPYAIDMVQFNDWETRWQDYVTMTCVLEEIPDVAGRQAVLRSALSHEWTILWSTGRLGITISEDIDTAVEKLRAYIRARRNPLLDRKLFHCRDQEEGESIDQYVAALIRIDRTCAYDNQPHCTRCHRPCGHGAALTETRIRDRLIYGLADKGIQQRVLEEDFSERLDLERVVTICKSMESSKETELRLTRENFSVIAARQSDAEYELTGGYSSINAARRSSYKKQRSTPQVDPVERCEFCGITRPSHVREECPALTRECHKCKQVGHFAAVCKWTRQKGKAPKAVGYVSLHRAGTRQEDQLVPISVQHRSNPPSKVCWLPDSGAEIDAMSEQDYMQLGTRPQELSPDPDRVHAAGGGELDSAGVFQANLQLGRNVCTTTVHVFKDLKT